MKTIASLEGASNLLDTFAKFVRLLANGGATWPQLMLPNNDVAARERLISYLAAGCPPLQGEKAKAPLLTFLIGGAVSADEPGTSLLPEYLTPVGKSREEIEERLGMYLRAKELAPWGGYRVNKKSSFEELIAATEGLYDKVGSPYVDYDWFSIRQLVSIASRVRFYRHMDGFVHTPIVAIRGEVIVVGIRRWGFENRDIKLSEFTDTCPVGDCLALRHPFVRAFWSKNV